MSFSTPYSVPRTPLARMTGSPSKRHNPATPSYAPQRRRVTIDSRGSSMNRSSGRGTPPGMPAPIQPRIILESAEDEADDLLDHVVMAVDKTPEGKVGCAYYVVREGHLRCMEDIQEDVDEVVTTLKRDIQPTTILLSPRSETLLEAELESQTSMSSGDDDQPILPYKLELRPSNDFKDDQALSKLASLPGLSGSPGVKFLVPGDEELFIDPTYADGLGMTDERGRALHISGCINLKSKVSVGCAGAVVTYLQRKGVSEFLQGGAAAEQAYQILRLDMFSLTDTMLLNSDTLAALQILQPESHPNTPNQGPGTTGAKESLSIYGLFRHFAKTPQGRKSLRSMFLPPSTSMQIIKERHDTISIFAKAENHQALQDMTKSLARIKDMNRIMVMLHKGIEGGTTNAGGIKSGVWSSLLDFCFHVIDLSETLRGVLGIELVPMNRRLQGALNRQELQRLGELMFGVVDLEGSQSQRRTVVKRGIDENLDVVKNGYEGMDEMLSQAAIETVPELPEGMPVPSLSVVYMPQFGFHITMPMEAGDDMLERGLPDAWERMFTTDTHAYFKNNRMRTIDSDLGDLWAIICEIEIEISHDLAQKVLEKETFIVEASDLCGELDSTLALAHGAAEYKLVRPRIVTENVIDIRGGRHLLQEMTVPAYVANDSFLEGGTGDDSGHKEQQAIVNPSMLLLTGPNYSGKSVYLRQIALIVYLAQVGSFVPAQYACLGVTDKIMTRITTRETVSRGQSSFMIDLQQISWALKAFTPPSLPVIDEFGKGTDICDGAGLAAGVLTYLLSQGNKAPKVLASTHFHEIFEQGLMPENMPGLGLRQMEVYVKAKTREERRAVGHNSEVTYLYNVRPGRSTLSYGAQCAEMNGVPSAVVKRACDLNDLAMESQDLVSICSQAAEEEIADLEHAEAVSRAFLELNLDALGEDEIANFKGILGAVLASSSHEGIKQRYRHHE